MKKQFFVPLVGILVLSGIALTASVPPVRAQDEATNSADLRRAIRERIEQTLRNDTTTNSPFIGLVGTLKSIGSATFTMTTVTGEEKTIQVSEGVPVLLGSTPQKLSEMVIGNGISVVGDPVDELVVEAKRVLVSSTPIEEKRRVVLGTITAWNQRTLTVTVRGSDASESFTVTRQTQYENIQGTTLAARALQVDQSVLVISTEGTGGARNLVRVRQLVPLE